MGDLLPPLAWLVSLDTRTGEETRQAVRTRRALVALRCVIGADRIRRPWVLCRLEYVRRKGRDLQAENDSSVAE